MTGFDDVFVYGVWEQKRGPGWIQVFDLRKLVMTITNLINTRKTQFGGGNQMFYYEHTRSEMPAR